MNARAKVASRPSIVLASVSALAVSIFWIASPVLGTKPDPLHTVTICHRTNSVTNPYVTITVDEASVDGDAGNDNGKGDHLLEHLGPVWDAGTVYPAPHNGDQWGDIIPPFYSDGSTPTGYSTLNWNEAGQTLFRNHCNFPGESAEESASESEDECVDETGEQSEQGDDECESASPSGEQSVEAGTGTPAGTQPDTAGIFGGGSPLPTVIFSLILLASLGGLAFANVRAVRRHLGT